ncbi:MAG: magnesium chelatase subunit D, partial [Phycisphaerales bacterium]|nr:magnesium chelatase subunit D [Hyphomonadaceae bacterium]
MSAADRSEAWAEALTAGALLAVDADLGGAIVRASANPARDAWLAHLRMVLPADAPMRRIPCHIDDDRLLGGLDLAATLAAGRPISSRGLLSEADGGAAILAMAERCTPGLASRLGAALDLGEVRAERDGFAARHPARIVLVALDEGAEPEECTPAALAERLAFHLNLELLRPDGAPRWTGEDVRDARLRLKTMAPPAEDLVESICVAASAFGVLSTRAALFTLRAARASAALAGRTHVGEEDLALAARLVLAPRARLAPPMEEAGEPPPPGDRSEQESETDTASDAAAERLVEAVRAALPADFLAQLLTARTERRAAARTNGSGAAAKSAQRGRPLGARAANLRSGDRLDLIATLRAAAPWQKLRRGNAPEGAGRVLVKRSDFRIRRFAQRLESTTIFVVDASGSTAAQRLAEAKGAVETLLAEAYVSRARVALIAFRERRPEMLLPPTRSLARAKRCLAALPGGGGTPLAAAIDAAMLLGLSERAKGRTPMLVLLTDGRGNIS